MLPTFRRAGLISTDMKEGNQSALARTIWLDSSAKHNGGTSFLCRTHQGTGTREGTVTSATRAAAARLAGVQQQPSHHWDSGARSQTHFQIKRDSLVKSSRQGRIMGAVRHPSQPSPPVPQKHHSSIAACFSPPVELHFRLCPSACRATVPAALPGGAESWQRGSGAARNRPLGDSWCSRSRSLQVIQEHF